MTHQNVSDWMRGRAMAGVATLSLALPLVATAQGTVLPTHAALGVSRTAPTLVVTQMTTKKKVVLLVGAAALYYLYRKHQAKKADAAMAPQGQTIYYLSKNGRVYYRDANHQAHWVTPPAQGIQVPYDEAQSYQGLRGYNQQATGETNLSRFATRQGGM